MSLIRYCIREKGIYDEAAEIILASWRPSSRRQYLSSIRKWCEFCIAKQIHPCRASVIEWLNFLQYLLNSNANYSSVGTARSALSFLLPRNESGSFGQHYFVKRFMKGVFNLRTSAPFLFFFNFIWDASAVLNFLRKLPDDNVLPLKLLTFKLVMLLALVSGQRVQTLSWLNLRFSYRVYDSLIFIIPDLTKTSGPGKIAAQVVLSQYDQNKKICVIRCLTKYLSRTLKHRSSSKLFLSLQKPFRPVGSQTLSRWIKIILRMSGVRTDIFGAHSTRSASSSKAKLAGLSVDTVLERYLV